MVAAKSQEEVEVAKDDTLKMGTESKNESDDISEASETKDPDSKNKKPFKTGENLLEDSKLSSKISKNLEPLAGASKQPHKRLFEEDGKLRGKVT